MNPANKHFVSFCFINKRKNILCKRFYYSFDQNSETFERFHFVSIMKNFGTEALFALFYAWTKKINTSFHLVLLINEKISSVNVYILLSIRTPDFWTVSFRYRISSISKLYYRRTFMIVDIPSVESGEKAIFNVFIFCRRRKYFLIQTEMKSFNN